MKSRFAAECFFFLQEEEEMALVHAMRGVDNTGGHEKKITFNLLT